MKRSASGVATLPSLATDDDAAMRRSPSTCLTSRRRRRRRAAAAVGTLAIGATLLLPLAGCATTGAAPATGRRTLPAVGVAAPATDATDAATAAATTSTRSIGSVPLRWTPAHRDTLALWIDSAGVATAGWRPQLVAVVAEAAEAWHAAGAPVRFVRVADSARADVRVRWRAWQATPGRGATTWTTNARGELVAADVVIVLAPAPRHPPSLTCELRGIALHELGHALGLPHDPSPNAVMYRETGPLSLTDHDRAALRSAYGGGGTAAARSTRVGG